MLGMRLEKGISEQEFEEKFGKSFENAYGRIVKDYERTGFVVRKDGYCRFTDNGFYVSNSVLSDLLSFDGEDAT